MARVAGRCPRRPSFCGAMRPTPALTFLIREKSAKAYARGHPLHNPKGGKRQGFTLAFSPAVTFGHAPLLHLGSFLRQQGGTCPLGHCGGSRHREAVTFPPEEIFKRTPPLENAFGYFYRFIKVAAGAGCNDKAKPWRNPAREGYGEPSP